MSINRTSYVCWYEGIKGVPKVGADFMKATILRPLFNENSKCYLYSLRDWSFNRPQSKMKKQSDVGEAINCLDKYNTYVESISSSAFFKFCSEIDPNGALYKWISRELPKKEWLADLSKGKNPMGRTVKWVFNNKTSLLDCIAEKDVAKGYAQMQYIETYFLIRELVKKSLIFGNVKIVFVLPNDETKYYEDLSNDLQPMLRADLGDAAIDMMDISVSIRSFQYGNRLDDRPYSSKEGYYISSDQIGSFFNYLPKEPKFIDRVTDL